MKPCETAPMCAGTCEPCGVEKRDLLADKAICEAATPGPWVWHGYCEVQQIDLVSKTSMRPLVLDVVRWGMRNAQVRFREFKNCIMKPFTEWAQYVVPYRREFMGINHPDAILIAEARIGWPHAIDRAIAAEARVAELEGLLREWQPVLLSHCQFACLPIPGDQSRKPELCQKESCALRDKWLRIDAALNGGAGK